MHRTEGPDYVTESGKRRHKETPLPATVVNKFFANALQEEICVTIENTGITLNASGAADRTAGWGQLYTAIQRIAVNVVGFGADPTGAADSAAAFTAAFAASKIIYVPPGTFLLNSAIVIPDEGMIIGAGKSSVIKAGTAAGGFTTSGISCYIEKLYIDGNGQTNYKAFSFIFSAVTQIMKLKDVIIDDARYYIDTNSGTSSDQGVLILENIWAISPRSDSEFLNCTDASTKYSPDVYGSKLICQDLASTAFAIVAKGHASSTAIRRITQSKLATGKAEIQTKKSVIIENSYLDLEWFFDGTEVTIIRNNMLVSVVTVTNDYNSNASRALWKDNDYSDGTSFTNIKGISTHRTRETTAQSIAGSTQANVDFNGELNIKMEYNSAHTKDTVWDAGTKEFDVLGFGDGHANIDSFIQVECDTQSWTEIQKVDVWIEIGGYPDIAMNRHIIEEGSATGKLGFSFNGRVSVGPGLTIRFIVDNNQTGAITIPNALADPYTTYARIEGL